MMPPRKPRHLGLLLALLLAATAQAVDYTDLAAKIRGYQFGDSRINLTWVEDIAQWSLDHPHERAKLADMLAGLLGGDATQACKQFACRQLVIVGGANQVPALSALLQDPAHADDARYALERIPSPKVDSALIELLADAGDATRVGIINTLGARGTVDAIPPLREIAEANDAAAEAAIAALGRITDRHALRALAKLKTAPEHALATAHARLAQATALADAGDARAAGRIYDDLADNPASDTIARAALLGRYRLGDAEERAELLDGLSDEKQTRIRDYAAARGL